MALTTLTLLKQHLGIALSDSSQDSALTQRIREASDTVRAEIGYNPGWMISGYTIDNPTVVTCPGHGLETGDVIVVSHSNGTTIDGEQAVTRISEDTFSVPVNVAATGTGGTFGKRYTEYLAGTGQQSLLLTHRPVQSVSDVRVDSAGYYGVPATAFDAASALVAGEGYVLDKPTSEPSRSGILWRIGTYWPRPKVRTEGLLTSQPGPALGNVKVTYVAGFVRIPSDLIYAVNMIVAQVIRTSASGASMQSESYDGYSYSLALNAQSSEMTGVRKRLAKYKTLVFA